jgi:hypothetical protein
MKIQSKMNVAFAVYSIIESLLKEDSSQSMILEAYCNGREQGLSITSCGFSGKYKKVCFSENRNSDEIVVYFGNLADFSMSGNIPDEECYDNKKYFKYNEFYDAALFIVSWLEKE